MFEEDKSPCCLKGERVSSSAANPFPLAIYMYTPPCTRVCSASSLCCNRHCIVFCDISLTSGLHQARQVHPCCVRRSVRRGTRWILAHLKRSGAKHHYTMLSYALQKGKL